MSGPLGWDYPAGAENDPRAPWNQRDAELCERCDGSGKMDDGEACHECDGSGEQPQPTREELEMEKADRALDDDKDRED